MTWNSEIMHVTEIGKNKGVEAIAGTLVIIAECPNAKGVIDRAAINHQCAYNLEKYLKLGYVPVGYGYCVCKESTDWRVMWRVFGKDVESEARSEKFTQR